MAANHEGEDAISAAESFLREANSERERMIPVTIKGATVFSLIDVGVREELRRLVYEITGSQDLSGKSHVENSATVIADRFRLTIYGDLEKGLEDIGGKLPEYITTEINKRELHFVNRLFFISLIKSGLEDSEYPDEEMRKFFEDLRKKDSEEKRKALIDLNTSFVQGGGKPDELFGDLSEGLGFKY